MSMESAPAVAPISDAERLTNLLRQIDQGQPAGGAQLLPLTRSADRTTRGLAKRLLALGLVQQARHDATRLLAEACQDLDFRHPGLLTEALQQAEAIGAYDR